MSKVLLITGASSDIGVQLLRAVYNDYECIYLQYRNMNSELEKCISEFSGFSQIVPVYADFTDINSVQTMIDKIKEFEDQISSQIETIKNAVNEKEIEELVNKCKSDLTSVEDQYRDFYTKSIAYLDQRPEAINEILETHENELLESLKMQKNVIEQI